MTIMAYLMCFASLWAEMVGETQLAIYGMLAAIFIRICADDLQ
jgi:hypothetical protein